MTEIGAGSKRAPKLGLSMSRDPVSRDAVRDSRAFQEPAVSRVSMDVVFSGICGATAAVSLGAMAWLGFDRASLALAPVALAGAVGSGYFVWRRLRPHDVAHDIAQAIAQEGRREFRPDRVRATGEAPRAQLRDERAHR